MIDYNKAFDASVQASADAGDPSGSSRPRYQQWAAQLHQYADEISDEAVAEQADKLAVLADQTVGVVERVRAEPTELDSQAMPRYAQDYARVGQEFHRNLVALDQACPGGS
ncbi:hypothetical protein [Mycolicibacterium mengxianglii]|uniref:hypothetical protein n=1 Tax=Mycolicibacterium mengxianglii TaxID=2736649 RepID=UPI0018EF1D5F|nr:hypothetical protein [Mycolicibacterium mengxianglii]